MQPRTIIRRAVVALAAVAMASVAIPRRANAAIDADLVRLSDNGIDFGDNTFFLGAPIGSGFVQWDIVSRFDTPRLIGTLPRRRLGQVRPHAHQLLGRRWRVHRHPPQRHTSGAPDNGHHHWSVDLSPANLMQITEVHVCTEISDDGVDFSLVDCSTRYPY
jgi:hypothetical protein